MAKAVAHLNARTCIQALSGFRRFRGTRRLVGCGDLPTGEEEVKVTKSETPVLAGVWCKELLRQ